MKLDLKKVQSVQLKELIELAYGIGLKLDLKSIEDKSTIGHYLDSDNKESQFLKYKDRIEFILFQDGNIYLTNGISQMSISNLGKIFDLYLLLPKL